MLKKEYPVKYKQDLAKVKQMADKIKKRNVIKQLCITWQCSERSIYRDLGSPNPAVRKIRSDSGVDRIRATKKELKMFRELVAAGKDLGEAKSIVEKKSKREISQYQVNKISNEIKNMDVPEESSFGESIEKFLQKYFKLDMIAPENGVKVKLGSLSFIVSKEDVNDVILILVNSYNRNCKPDNKLKLDRNQLVRQKIYHVIEQTLRTAEQTSSVKDLEAITRMKKRLDIQTQNLNPNFKIVEKVCKELKPDISFDDIYHLIEKHSAE
jgi:uncharacterized membrane protein YheB (UPF0754 family)